jgi:predicted XRE-type DNA-binding protein
MPGLTPGTRAIRVAKVRAALMAFCLVLISSAAFSQAATGSIFGLVSDSVAHLVASAPVEAKNLDTGMVFRSQSGEAGLYRFTGLTAGTYEVTVKITNVGDFVQQAKLTVKDAPVRLDVILPLP